MPPWSLSAIVLCLFTLTPFTTGHVAAVSAEDIFPNHNQTPAGSLADGVLRLRLRASVGIWRPEGLAGRQLTVEAFGEEGGPLSSPAPLVRVREGTQVVVSVRNELPHPLRVHGFCEKGTGPCAPFEVKPGVVYETTFKTGPAGTYAYWATSTGMPQPFRASDDTQLSGAFVVDPRDGPIPDDRILVITEWTSVTRAQLRDLVSQDDPGAAFLKLRPDGGFAINGASWPHTERFRYKLSDTVRWRVVNLSTQVHPMHLHGFYFEVDSLGDGPVDRPFAPGRRPRVVTQVLAPGATLAMTWKPERAGNWLFHCHVMTHVSPVLNLDGSPKAHAGLHHDADAGAGMTGMVLGVIVDGPGAEDSWPEESVDARKLTLAMEPQPQGFGDAPALAFSLETLPGQKAPSSVPGPTLVLARGEPVEITLVNRLSEATAIHWHGMELESYYDGVHGWGRTGQRVTPMIEPGQSFVVRFTPPSTGTFMYHTHLHDHRQLTSGLYGAMIVVETGAAFDETTDHVLVLGRGGPQPGAPVVINNSRTPEYVWKASVRHRIRLINITPDDIVQVTLRGSDGPVSWRPLTKDGAPVTGGENSAPANQVIGVGETYDFEYTAAPGRRTLWLEVQTPGGRWLVQGRVIVR